MSLPPFDNQKALFLYLNPEMDVQSLSDLDAVILLHGSTEKFDRIPRDLDTHNFLSQNLHDENGKIELYRTSLAISQGFIRDKDNRDAIFAPVLNVPLKWIDLNKFVVTRPITTIETFLFGKGSIVKIHNFDQRLERERQCNTIVCLITDVDQLTGVLTIENKGGAIREMDSPFYVIQSVQIIDVARVAYVLYYRQILMMSPPTLVWDPTPIDFNYGLYTTLYPELQSMAYNEAYIDFLFKRNCNNVKSSQLVIGETKQIQASGNQNNNNNNIVLGPDEDVSLRNIKIKHDGMIDFDGVTLSYATTNDIRHSSQVPCNGLITEFAIKSYVDRKFDEYAELNELNVTGNASMQKQLTLFGDMNCIGPSSKIKICSFIDENAFVELDHKQWVLQGTTIDIKDGTLSLGGNSTCKIPELFVENTLLSHEIETSRVHVVNGNVDVDKGEILIGQGGLVSKYGSIALEHGDLALQKGNLELADGDFILKKGHMEIYMGDIIARGGDMEVVNGDVKVVKGNVLIDEGNIEMKLGSVSLSRGDLILDLGAFTVHNGDTSLKNGDLTLAKGDLYVGDGNMHVVGDVALARGMLALHGMSGISLEDGNITLVNGSTTLGSGDIYVLQGDIKMKEGSMYVDKGSVYLGHGDVLLDQGNVLVSKGHIDLILGNMNINNGSIIVKSGDIELDDGNMTLENGTMKVISGDVDVALGDINVDHGHVRIGQGDVEVSRGNLVVTQGDTILKKGCLDLKDGDIKLGNGSLFVSGGQALVVHGDVRCLSLAANVVEVDNSLTLRQGNVELKDGDVLVTSGDVHMARGNLILESECVMDVAGKVQLSKHGMLVEGSIIELDYSSGLHVHGLADFRSIESKSCSIVDSLNVCNESFSVSPSLIVASGPAFVIDSALSVFQKPTIFNHNVEFNESIFFNNVVKAPMIRANDASFDFLQVIKGVDFKGPVTLSDNSIFKGQVDMNQTNINRANIVQMNSQSANITSLTCSGLANLSSLEVNGEIVTSNLTVGGKLKLISPFIVNSIEIPGSLTCSKQQNKFLTPSVIVDNLLITTDFNVTNEASIKVLNVETLFATKIAFGEGLIDAKRLNIGSTATFGDTVLAKGPMQIHGLMTLDSDLHCKSDIGCEGTIGAMMADIRGRADIQGNVTVMGSTTLSNGLAVHGPIMMSGPVTVLDSDELIFNKGYKVKSGTRCIYERGSETLHYGVATFDKLNTTSLNSVGVANMEKIVMSGDLTANANVFVGGNVRANKINVTKADMIDAIGLGTLEFPMIKATSTLAASTIQVSSMLEVMGTMTASSSTGVTFGDNVDVKVGGKIGCEGLADFQGGVHVGNGGSLLIDTATICHQKLDVNGPITARDTASFNQNVACHQDLTINRDLYVAGTLHLQQDINLNKNITIENLTVKQKAILSSNLDVAGPVVCSSTAEIQNYMTAPRIGIGCALGLGQVHVSENNSRSLTLTSLDVVGAATFSGGPVLIKPFANGQGQGQGQGPLLKVDGKIEASSIVQLSDKRSKFDIKTVSDDDVLRAIQFACLQDYSRVGPPDLHKTLGFVAQDFIDSGTVLSRCIVSPSTSPSSSSSSSSSSSVSITLADRPRQVRISKDQIRLSDGISDSIFEKGQTLVTRDGLKLTLMSVSANRRSGTLTVALDPIETNFTIVAIDIDDPLKIDQSGLLAIAVGACSALYRKVLDLEAKIESLKVK